MENSFLERWISDQDYFSTLAILSQGALHPGGVAPNSMLAARLNWSGVQVLDLGGGTGQSHRFFSALGAKVHSVEPNEWMRMSAVRAGVDPEFLIAAKAEELNSSWLCNNFDRARLLVQGVTGFLSDGLGTLAPILEHPSIVEVAIVDWIKPSGNFECAPVKHTYRAADYVASVEDAGFKSISLETFSYCAPNNSIKFDDAAARVGWHFPELKEFNVNDEIELKIESIKLSTGDMKNYIILIAKK